MATDASLLRDVAELLLEGGGPDFAAGMDERYGEWLLDLAGDLEDGTRSL